MFGNSSPQRCPSCKGSGPSRGTTLNRCENCKGTGQHVQPESKENVLHQRITTCSDCGGRGPIIEETCPECHGTSQTTQDQTLTVQIPVGVEEGMATCQTRSAFRADKNIERSIRAPSSIEGQRPAGSHPHGSVSAP
jgi:DnaJ-class molecular chaperone